MRPGLGPPPQPAPTSSGHLFTPCHRPTRSGSVAVVLAVVDVAAELAGSLTSRLPSRRFVRATSRCNDHQTGEYKADSGLHQASSVAEIALDARSSHRRLQEKASGREASRPYRPFLTTARPQSPCPYAFRAKFRESLGAGVAAPSQKTGSALPACGGKTGRA